MGEDTKITESKALNGIAKKVSPKKATKAKPTNAKTVKKSPKPTRNYQIVTVEKSLIIAQKLKEMNGGNPWTPKDVKVAINLTDNNKFFYCSQASRDFGFTIGTRDAKEIALTDFGRSTVYTPDVQTEKRKKNRSIFKNRDF
ncbi:hypothetical protein [Confluentibacter lentus]|uniref:hypothetical protein n=1 Tax=Confluentibacter lentus TaxID=1699412 RepID=UPI000C283A07|nr:hypothetical protein [Confluentibacter lentus]